MTDFVTTNTSTMASEASRSKNNTNSSRRQRTLQTSTLFHRHENSEKSTKTTAHQLAPINVKSPTQPTNNIQALHNFAQKSIHEGKMFRALSYKERKILLETGTFTFNQNQNVPGTWEEVVRRSTEQIENGSNYKRDAKEQAPVSFAKTASLLMVLHLAKSYSSKYGSGHGPGNMIVSTTAHILASNATSASIDTSKLPLKLTSVDFAAASNLNEIHVYGKITVNIGDIIWQDGDFINNGLQLAKPTYPVEDATWILELKKHGLAMMRKVRVQTTGTVNRVRIDAALSRLSEVLDDGALRALKRISYIRKATTVLITSRTSHASLSKKTKQAETTRKDVCVISEGCFLTEVERFVDVVQAARAASGNGCRSPEHKKRRTTKTKKNENNGAKICRNKDCENPALTGNYGRCSTHRDPNKTRCSGSTSSSSKTSSSSSSSSSSGRGTTVAQLKRNEMLSYSAKFYGVPPSTDEEWKAWLKRCVEKRNKKSTETWLNSKEGKAATKNYEKVVKDNGWKRPSGSMYVRLKANCPVPSTEGEGGGMMVETWERRRSRLSNRQVGEDGLSRGLRNHRAVGEDGLSRSLRNNRAVGDDGLSNSLRYSRAVGDDGLSRGLRRDRAVATIRREQETVDMAQTSAGVSINPHFSDKDLKAHVQKCLDELAQIKDKNDVSMIDDEFAGRMYIFATTDARRDVEWYSTLAKKPLLWVSKNGKWNRASSDDIKAMFDHFYLSFSDRNLLNTDAIERLLQTHLTNHPRKLWEGEGHGILGNAEERSRPGTWLVGVTFTRKALPSNWSISKQKPMANTQQPAY
jgi:hypothetical protein